MVLYRKMKEDPMSKVTGAESALWCVCVLCVVCGESETETERWGGEGRAAMRAGCACDRATHPF